MKYKLIHRATSLNMTTTHAVMNIYYVQTTYLSYDACDNTDYHKCQLYPNPVVSENNQFSCDRCNAVVCVNCYRPCSKCGLTLCEKEGCNSNDDVCDACRK